MDLDNIDAVHEELYFGNKINTSPFFMSSRASTSSPQPWELHDVDFLLPGPAVAASRSNFQESARRYNPSLPESELTCSELDDTTKPLAFRSGIYWQDMTLNDSGTNEFSSYLVDDAFTDRLSVVSKSPSLSKSPVKMSQPTRLRVNAQASALQKNESSVVSPTMVDKKILVTDNDLRLFSEGSSSMSNMRALRGDDPKSRKSSPRPVRERGAKVAAHTKPRSSSVAHPSMSTTTPRQLKKRYASPDMDFADYDDTPGPKYVKVSDPATWSAPTFDPRWLRGRADGFHGMQPRLVSPINASVEQDCNGASIYRSIVQQVTGQLPPQQQLSRFQPHQQKKLRQPQSTTMPKRKIGIYSPTERRERLKRFHEKRKLRVYHKRIKYDCRKRLANSCPRIKGRFVRKSDYQAKTSEAASPSTSETASSSKDGLL
ncbi:unnamed protein product [Phytophthora fragariaefolia]|uniref:Unnamed protein product n=1 Tax=Phytophthora fragariaefolia TaxID=1490495 RepID=A0A9W6WU42_9STRA|nr:unnamed protein product [Phytophthora fragariaefolia]